MGTVQKTRKSVNLFRIHGGKYYLAKWIIDKFPPHTKYVEGCLGAGSIFYNKPYVPSILYETHYNIWAIHYHLKYVAEAVKPISCNIDTFNYWQEFNPLNHGEIALKEYVLRKMSRVGNKKDFSTTNRLRGGRHENINAWENSKTLTHFINLSSKATIKHDSIFNHNFREDELIYVDPPYLHTTRATAHEYGPHEWTEETHKQLIQIAKNSPGMWFISGYPSTIYDELGWKCYTKEVKNSASQQKNKPKKIECLWTNT